MRSNIYLGSSALLRSLNFSILLRLRRHQPRPAAVRWRLEWHVRDDFWPGASVRILLHSDNQRCRRSVRVRLCVLTPRIAFVQIVSRRKLG